MNSSPSSSADADGRHQVVRIPAFRRFWGARVLSGAAAQVVAVAVGWQIYDLTGSTLQLGLVGLAQFLPVVLLTLPAGHAADRYDRRRIAALCQSVATLAIAALALGSARGWVTTAAVYSAVAVLGAARAFEQPSFTSLLPGLVPPAAFPQAAALSASAVQTASILGPALGGLLYALGPAVPYAVAATMFGLAAALSSSIRTARPPPRREPASLRSVFSGIHFIRSRPAILGAISLDLFAVLLGGATALLPVYARDILHAGPWGLGLLRSAPAIGALLVSFALARRPLRRHAGLKMFAGVATFGLATIAFALSRSVALSVATLLVLGASDVISVVVRQSLVQLRTPDDMRGRVSAVNSLFIGTSNQLGEFESGITAALLGTVPAVVAGGLGTLLVAALWMRLFPELRRVDDLQAEAVPAVPLTIQPAPAQPG